MKIKGEVWLYLVLIAIVIKIIHWFFYFSTEGLSEGFLFIITFFRVLVFVSLIVFGLVLIGTIADNFKDIWKSVEDWCNKHLSVGYKDQNNEN